MVLRIIAGGALIVSILVLGDGGVADGKGVCLTRAIEQGYAFRNQYGAVVYRPYLPTAEDVAACDPPAPGTIGPSFTG